MPSPTDILTCPYDKAHQIQRYKLNTHLQKCRKQYPRCDKVTCPFDTTHVVNDVELDYHISVCPKRGMLDTQMYVMDDDHKPEVTVISNIPAITTEEDWDNDATCSYRPELAVKGAHVITKIKGATPSERRKARMEGIKTFRPQQNE